MPGPNTEVLSTRDDVVKAYFSSMIAHREFDLLPSNASNDEWNDLARFVDEQDRELNVATVHLSIGQCDAIRTEAEARFQTYLDAAQQPLSTNPAN